MESVDWCIRWVGSMDFTKAKLVLWYKRNNKKRLEKPVLILTFHIYHIVFRRVVVDLN